MMMHEPPPHTVQQQQRWLLVMRHSAKCQVALGTHCQAHPHCAAGKQLWRHILECLEPQCAYPACVPAKALLAHHRTCQVGAEGTSWLRQYMPSGANGLAHCMCLHISPCWLVSSPCVAAVRVDAVR